MELSLLFGCWLFPSDEAIEDIVLKQYEWGISSLEFLLIGLFWLSGWSAESYPDPPQ